MNETRAASGDAHLAETAGLVLAGGRSSRMGADKALLRFPGGTLLERTMERIGSLAGPLVLSLAPGQRLPEGLRLPPGLLMATDGEPWQGPLWGLAEGFRALAGRARRVLVVPVDMPNLTLPWMNRLLQGLDDDGETLACMYRHRGYLNGLTAAYDLRIQGRLEELIGGGRHRLSLLGEGVPRRVLDTAGEDAPLPHPLDDVDTPEAYRGALLAEGVGNPQGAPVTVEIPGWNAGQTAWTALFARNGADVLAALKTLYPERHDGGGAEPRRLWLAGEKEDLRQAVSLEGPLPPGGRLLLLPEDK